MQKYIFTKIWIRPCINQAENERLNSPANAFMVEPPSSACRKSSRLQQTAGVRPVCPAGRAVGPPRRSHPAGRAANAVLGYALRMERREGESERRVCRGQKGRGQLVTVGACRGVPGQRGKVSPPGESNRRLLEGLGQDWLSPTSGSVGNSPGKCGRGWDGEVGSRVHPVLQQLCTFAKI